MDREEQIKRIANALWHYPNPCEFNNYNLVEELVREVFDNILIEPIDLISRRDAIDAMWKALYAYEDLTEKQFMEYEELELEDWFQHRIFVQRMHEECMKAVNSLPSAEQKTGEWIENVVRWGDKITTVHGYRCSECGELNLCKDKFCPNCGIRMKVGENE